MSTTAILIANVVFILFAAGLTATMMWLPSVLVAGGDQPGSHRRRAQSHRR